MASSFGSRGELPLVATAQSRLVLSNKDFSFGEITTPGVKFAVFIGTEP
jgi:hypothetical protein